MKSRFIGVVFAVAAILVLGALQASASPIPCTPSSGPGTETYCANIFATYSTEQAPTWTQSVVLPKFNETDPHPGKYYALNSVNGVVITLYWDTTGEVDVANLNAAAESFTNAQSDVPLLLTGPGDLNVITTAVAGPIASASKTPTKEYKNGVLQTPHFGDKVPGAVGFTVGENEYQGVTGTGSQSANDSLNRGDYEGFGSHSLTFSASSSTGNFSGNAAPGVFFGGNALVGGEVGITYNYHEVNLPEPFTLFSVGSALIAVALGFQRKRRKA